MNYHVSKRADGNFQIDVRMTLSVHNAVKLDEDGRAAVVALDRSDSHARVNISLLVSPDGHVRETEAPRVDYHFTPMPG
jgi:hypothetical protein